MKTNEKQILDEVEKTLLSIDNMPVLNENPFFYKRVKATIENEGRGIADSKSFLLKPVLLIIIVAINIITAIYYLGIGRPSTSTYEILINSLKQEYSASQSINNLF